MPELLQLILHIRLLHMDTQLLRKPGDEYFYILSWSYIICLILNIFSNCINLYSSWLSMFAKATCSCLWFSVDPMNIFYIMLRFYSLVTSFSWGLRCFWYFEYLKNDSCSSCMTSSYNFMSTTLLNKGRPEFTK